MDAGQFTFLGRGWTHGVAQEAALKMREAAGAWTEAYPAKEYRHGPISVTGPRSVVWWLGEGASDVARGLDPDEPRHLTRSVILG